MAPRSGILRTLAVVSLGGLVIASCTGDERAEPPVTTTPRPAVTAPTAPVTIEDLGRDGWQVQAVSADGADGAAVSTAGYPAAGWLTSVPDDAGGPGTLVEVLVQNGFCPELEVSDNLDDCRNGPGGEGGGDPAIPPFDVPWWFRTEFVQPDDAPAHTELVVNGVIGEADLWVNGVQVADGSTLTGAFTQTRLDVTDLVRPGPNAVALFVAPNDPSTMFTLSHVDWTARPPDDNAGIHFPVQLHRSGPLRLDETWVDVDLAADLGHAELTVRATLANPSQHPVAGRFEAWISPPAGDAFAVRLPISLAPDETRSVRIGPDVEPALRVTDPAVWWPADLGDQPLYGLTTLVTVDGDDVPSDGSTGTFGIRKVTSELLGAGPLSPDGVRRFSVNGVPVLIRAAGWTEDLLLRHDDERMADELALVGDLGLNAVRLEGHEMPDAFYQRADELGLLVDAGFQCCMGAWERGPDDPPYTDAQREIYARSSARIGQRLRNHPSVFTWGWSDLAPTAEQEDVTLAAFAEVGFDVPVTASVQHRASPVLGPSGKRSGPYNWVPAAYWYDTARGAASVPGDPSLGNLGMAWGFTGESGAGHSIPTLDSLRRFMSADELESLWRDPSAPQYHASPSEPFAAPEHLHRAVSARFGTPTDLADFVRKAHAQNYEDTRAQFEAFVANADASPTPATGLVYWQLSKGWPSLLWALYNHDLDQAGGFAGAQVANRPLHVLLREDDDTVVVANHRARPEDDLTVETRVVDLAGQVLDRQEVDGIALQGVGLRHDVVRPRLPAPDPTAPARVVLVELTLRRGSEVLDRNVYWRSTRRDVIDWTRTPGAGTAAMTSYADLRALAEQPPAEVSLEASGDPADGRLRLSVRNPASEPGPAAFLVRLDLRRCRDGAPLGGDDQLTGVAWSGNHLTVWPGQTVEVTARFRPERLDGEVCVTGVGWNTPDAVART